MSTAAEKLRETERGLESRHADFETVCLALQQDDRAAAVAAIRRVMAAHAISPEWDKFRQMTALMNRANATLDEEPSYNLAAADVPVAFSGLAERWPKYWPLLEAEQTTTGNLMAATAALLFARVSPYRGLGLARDAALRNDLDAPSLNACGNMLLEGGEPEAALAAYRKASVVEPRNPAIWSNLGRALEGIDQVDEALQAHRNAVALMPEHPEIAFNYGNLLTRVWRLDDAERELRRTLSIKPDHYPAMLALANNLQAMRRCGEAADIYARVLRARPDDPLVWSNYLMNLPYLPTLATDKVLAEHRRYAGALEQDVPVSVPVRHSRVGRRLRVGYFAAYYRNHPAGWLSEAAIAAHDPGRVEIYFYINNRSEDGALDRLAPGLAAVRDISGFDDAAAADLIAEDELDLLIDLSGHTRDNRLAVLARKPAPVIAAWPVSYWNTTGLTAVDWLIGDPLLTPAKAQGNFVEKIARLPDASICYRPPEHAPDVATLPMLANGFVTFGCFNRLAKINNPVITAWSAIMARLPEARLRLQCRSLDTQGVADDVRGKFRELGVSSDRIDLIGRRSHAEMLADYDKIDLVLDPFPWTGSIVTCEAMWMGVPTITLYGDSIVSRYSMTYQTVAGLSGFSSENVEEYIGLAVLWSKRAEELALLRARLRDQIARSPLCDGPGFARNLENLFEMMVADRG